MSHNTYYIAHGLKNVFDREQVGHLYTILHHFNVNYVICPTETSEDQFLQQLDPERLVVLGTQATLAACVSLSESFDFSRLLLFGSLSNASNHSDFLKMRLKHVKFFFAELSWVLFQKVFPKVLNQLENKPAEDILRYLFQKNEREVFRRVVQSSKERGALQDQVIHYCEQQSIRQGQEQSKTSKIYIKNISQILDEFLMNAIWDANQKYALRDRAQYVELLPQERVNVECLWDDGDFLVLSVSDQFGAFRPRVIEKYMTHVQGILPLAHEPQSEVPGAGLGLLMVLQKIGILIYEIEIGTLTRATVVANLREPYRDMQRRARTFLVFQR